MHNSVMYDLNMTWSNRNINPVGEASQRKKKFILLREVYPERFLTL